MRYEAPLLITGCPRTGTTGLASCLSLHPDICILHEASVYDLQDNEMASKRPFGSGDFPMPPGPARAAALEAVRSGKHTNEQIREAIFDAVGAEKPLSVYGDKMPASYLEQMEYLNRRYPEARFIVMLRDGRDVVASQIRWYRRRQERGQSIAWWMASSVETAPTVWLESMQRWERLRGRIPRDRWLEVDYERATRAPEQTMRAICDLVGLPYEAEKFRECIANFRPIRVGQWREDLPDLERQLSWRFRRTLRAWGYK